MRKFTLALVLLLIAPVATAQVAVTADNSTGQTVMAYRLVSGTNAAQTAVLELSRIRDLLAVHVSCSSGTGTLLIEASSDNSNWLTIDSLTAAASNLKQYFGASTVGGTVALSPLSFKFVRLTAGSCGASASSTMTVGGK